MNKLIIWFVLASVLVIGAVGAYWWFDLRWRPRTIVKHQAEITKILESSGWVSPGLTGPRLYMIGFRGCPDCIRLKAEEFPKYLEAGVDARVILIARGDSEGAERSTAAERATVAELWINRNWLLMERWDSEPVEAWTAQGVPPADGDMARTAVIQAGRTMVEDLRPLLAANGVKVGRESIRYPTLIWWTRDGEMKACACERPETYRFVRKALDVK
ncbi:MAG: hypothetical protein Q8L66_02070 [Caulobacter sp.]|nr:hypothetical protein [Caulobacter sp.]